MEFWINTISCDHVKRGINGEFTQASHGKRSGLSKLMRDDIITFYSPRTEFHGGDPLQAFTAIGKITDDEPYQVEMRPDFHPWRRQVEFLVCHVTPIRPLIEDLDFIENKTHWGYPFRQGLFKIGEKDFQLIAKTMEAELEKST